MDVSDSIYAWLWLKMIKPQPMDGLLLSMTIFRDHSVPNFEPYQYDLVNIFHPQHTPIGLKARWPKKACQQLGGVESTSDHTCSCPWVPWRHAASGQGQGTQLHALHQVQAGIRASRKWARCRDGVFFWRRDGAMKLIRCRDGVFYWRRGGAMKLIRCRDGVFYWRRDGAKNKTVRCHDGVVYWCHGGAAQWITCCDGVFQ